MQQQDWMSPAAVSAKKTGPKKIEVLMSESVGNIIQLELILLFLDYMILL